MKDIKVQVELTTEEADVLTKFLSFQLRSLVDKYKNANNAPMKASLLISAICKVNQPTYEALAAIHETEEYEFYARVLPLMAEAAKES